MRKLKKIFAMAMAVVIAASGLMAMSQIEVAADSPITATLDGKSLTFDVNPYINGDSRTMIEARSISTNLGAEILWDSSTKTVTITKEETTLKLVIGQTNYTLNDSVLTMDTAPIIVDGRTMVPLRFVSEALGLEVTWDQSTRNVGLIKNFEPVSINSDEVSSTTETTERSYNLVTTGQSECYDADGNITDPSEGDACYGQDAQYASLAFSFTDNGDATVTDNNTGLMWQVIPIDEKMSWEEAEAYCASLELAGYDDWRVPSLKELFSISDFETGWPYLDTDYFDFPEGSTSAMPEGMSGGPQGSSSSESDNGTMMPPPQGTEGESGTMMPPPQGTEGENGTMMPPPGASNSEMTETDTESNEMPPPSDTEDSDGVSKAQGQFWSSNFYYVGTTHGDSATAFGVNHATGHIKGYPSETSGDMGKYVRAVRGDLYGVNDFEDNEDGTITDEATGLMWMQTDSGEGMEWDDALAYAEDFTYAGYDDWRLPDVKELQSIVDYTGVYPAIDDDYFETTELEENEFYYFWTNTSAYFSTLDPGYGYAWYVAFGFAVDDEGNDTHGAGAVRFSPKYTESAYAGEGGDNIMNSVRLVRNVD